MKIHKNFSFVLFFILLTIQFTVFLDLQNNTAAFAKTSHGNNYSSNSKYNFDKTAFNPKIQYINFYGIELPENKITINGNNIPLRPLIVGLTHEFHINYSLSNAVKGYITLHINKIYLNKALKIIFEAGHLNFSVKNRVLFIGTSSSLKNKFKVYKIKLKNIPASKAISLLTPMMPKGGKVIALPNGNEILVYDLSSNIKQINKIIKNIDVKKRIVRIQAKIVDISNNFTRNLGVSWSISPYANSTITTTGTSISGFSTPVALSSGTMNLNIGTSWQNFGLISAQLSMGQQLGYDKIISSPDVTVVSGSTATINSGTTLYYTAYTAASGTGTSTAPSSATGGTTIITQQPITSTLQTITLGLTLTVTPIIESGGNIILNLTVTNSQPNFGQEVDGFPSATNQSVTTTVSVKNNSTLVLGGILYTEKSRSNNGIPLLSNIPILGYLFSSRQKVVNKEQLMVFISPKLIK
jgi:type IV pilus assembly protein PilQ